MNIDFKTFLQALESKLASCRNFVQDHPRNGKNIHGVTPITDSPK